MPSAPENDPSGIARRRLTEACRTKDTSVRLAWAITVCEAILLAGFALALIDYWLMLPVLLRSVGALGLATLAAVGVIRLVRFYRRPTRLKEAALDIESERPDYGCEVSTAAEYLAEERKPTQEYEPELVAALQKRAAERLSRGQVPYERKLIPPGVLLAATLLVLLVLVTITPVAMTALQRTALPFSEARYTRVEVKPGHVELPVGSSLEITNTFSGRIPKDPQFHWQEEGSAAWQSVPLTKSPAGTYLHSLTNLRSTVRYRVTGNDAESAEFKIKTYIPPEVKDLSIGLQYPAYTGRAPTRQKAPDVTAVRASTAEFRIEPTVELAKARLRFASLPDVPLTADPDGSWNAQVKISKDTDYWIELADNSGHVGVNAKPHHITALPDRPPQVETTDPGKDARAAATNKVPVTISVSDDFGVGDIKLVFHKLGGEEQVVTAQRQSETNGEITARAELDLASLGLGDYQLVAYHAEAADNNSLDGPGIGKSPVYFVEITNEEGGSCLSQGQSQKVNLLVIQKQIIADTAAFATNAAGEKFEGMATRQRDAMEFGKLYLDGLSGDPAAAAASREMQAAIDDMEKAARFLDRKTRTDAISSEEGALAHLYQVIKMMPELENLPTTPRTSDQKPPPSEKLQVVLEAIKKQKKEARDNQEIEQALEEARKLAESQAGLNSALRHPAEGGRGQGKSGKNPGQTPSKGSGSSGAGESENPSDSPGTEEESPGQLAKKEEALSKEAAALAEKLKRLAGKDSRVGHNAGKSAARAAARMAGASQAMKQGSMGAAGEEGMEGELALRTLVAQLERLLRDRPDPSDIASEDFPKAYEALISEYLRALSHAE